MYSKISDVRSSQDSQRVDMKTTNSKELGKTLFDSGVISENNLSEEIIETGVDIDELRSLENEKVQRVQQGENISSSDKTEVEEQMRLDSGIDIDLSDQFYSKSDVYSDKNIELNEKAENEEKEKSSVTKSSVLPLNQIFECDEEGNTQLHWAIIERFEQLVKRILAVVPNSELLDVTNKYSQTCLHLSVLTNQQKITRLLLLAGAKTNIEDRNGNTPLHLACKINSYECVEALLTPVTVYEEKYALFRYSPIIDLPSRYLNDYNYDGVSCIHIATRNTNVAILRQLLIYGADVNIRECKGGYTILHEAVESGNIELVRYILQHPGLDLEKNNYARLTAYQLSYRFPNISRILLEKSASRLMFVEENSDDDYSDEEDKNDSDYDYDEYNINDTVVVDEVSRLMNSLNSNETFTNT